MSFNLQKLIIQAKSSDRVVQITAVQCMRVLVSLKIDPPIDLLISCGILPILIDCLSDDSNPPLQIEAAWALTNIAAGTSPQTHAVSASGAVPILIKLLVESRNTALCEQVLWALSNIIGDGPLLRDLAIGMGVVEPLLKFVIRGVGISTPFLRKVTWVIGNLCRNIRTHPPKKSLYDILPALNHMIYRYSDAEILAESIFALGHLMEGGTDKIQKVIDSGVLPKLVSLLSNQEVIVKTAAIMAVGNIVTGTVNQAQAVLNCDALRHFIDLLKHTDENILQETIWCLSNVAAGNHIQIQAIIDAQLIPLIINGLDNGNVRIQRHAAWALVNLTQNMNKEQESYFIDCGIISLFCNLLCHTDSEVIKVTLEGIRNILKFASANDDVKKVHGMIKDCGGLLKIKSLLDYENENIPKIADDIKNFLTLKTS